MSFVDEDGLTIIRPRNPEDSPARATRQGIKRIRDLWRKHSILPEDYFLWLDDQGGLCGCCGKKSDHEMALCVDHEPETKVVRGLICQSCHVKVMRHEAGIEQYSQVQKYLGSDSKPLSDEPTLVVFARVMSQVWNIDDALAAA